MIREKLTKKEKSLVAKAIAFGKQATSDEWSEYIEKMHNITLCRCGKGDSGEPHKIMCGLSKN